MILKIEQSVNINALITSSFPPRQHFVFKVAIAGKN